MKNRLKQLETCGQSPWLDYLRRSLIEKGELCHLIERNGLKEVTNHPRCDHRGAVHLLLHATGAHLGEKMPSTMRFGFGGDVEGQEPIDPRRKLRIRYPAQRSKRPQAPLDSAIMLDKVPIRTPSAARLIECPPRREAKPADPCALVIFGATGDLTKRLVVTALLRIFRAAKCCLSNLP